MSLKIIIKNGMDKKLFSLKFSAIGETEKRLRIFKKFIKS